MHLLPSGLYRRCRSFNGSAICNMVSDILPMGRGLYRRLGLSPDPEDSGRKCMEKILLFQVNAFRQLADFILQVFGNAEFVAAPGFYPGLQIAVGKSCAVLSCEAVSPWSLRALPGHWRGRPSRASSCVRQRQCPAPSGRPDGNIYKKSTAVCRAFL